MHTRFLKKSVTISTRAAEPGHSERVAIADASGAENLLVLLVERSPEEAAVETAKDYFFRLPNDFANRILRQAIEEIISPVLSANADKPPIPQIDDIGGGAEIKVTCVRLAWTEFPFQMSSSVQRDDCLVIGRRRIPVTVPSAKENESRIRINRRRRPDAATSPIESAYHLTLTVEFRIDLESPAQLSSGSIDCLKSTTVVINTIDRMANEHQATEDCR